MRRRQFLWHGIQLGLLASPMVWLTSQAKAQFHSIKKHLQELSKYFSFPGTAKFNNLKKIVNQLLSPDDPKAILQTQNLEEIEQTIHFCSQTKLPVYIRSGGHSFEAFCMGSGLVVDVRQLTEMVVDEDQGWVKVGGGVTLGLLRQFLEQQGLSFPTGNCPTVGLAGYILGGGHSKQSRLWGLGVDCVQAMDVVLANGKSYFVSPENHKDLYWALLGGGGGNFAVVTHFYLDLIAKTKEVSFSLRTDQADYAQLFADWEQFILRAPDHVTANLFLSLINGKPQQIRMAGLISQPIINDIDPDQVFMESLPQNLRQHFETGQKHVRLKGPYSPPLQSEAKTFFKGSSHYADEIIGTDGFNLITKEAQNHLGTDISGIIEISPMGGKILSPQRENCYPHRTSLYTLGIFIQGPHDSNKQKIFQSAAQFHSSLDPLFSGRHYVNYPDRSLNSDSSLTWAQRYYGESLDELIRIKKQYDPENVFNYGTHSLASLV